MRFTRSVLTVVAASLLLAGFVTAASARELSTTETRITATFARVEFTSPGGATRCNLTASGSFHSRKVPKVLETLTGYITSASIGGCDPGTGSATVLTATLPWHVRYNGFAGSLPTIANIRAKLIGMAFRVREPNGLECLTSSTTTSPATITFNVGALGAITSVDLAETVSCFFIEASLRGTTNSIAPSFTITLI